MLGPVCLLSALFSESNPASVRGTVFVHSLLCDFVPCVCAASERVT